MGERDRIYASVLQTGQILVSTDDGVTWHGIEGHALRGQLYRRQEEELQRWDWRIVSLGNGEIVATSGGQGFNERNDARESLGLIRPDLAIDPEEVEDR